MYDGHSQTRWIVCGPRIYKRLALISIMRVLVSPVIAPRDNKDLNKLPSPFTAAHIVPSEEEKAPNFPEIKISEICTQILRKCSLRLFSGKWHYVYTIQIHDELSESI